MRNTEEVSGQTRAQLDRPIGGQVHFSDVFPEVDGSKMWWRKTDFDAGLTVAVESSGFPVLEQVPIGLRPWLANYGLVLVDDLVRTQQVRVQEQERDKPKQPDKLRHADQIREADNIKKAIIAVANYAPRDEANTAHGANGSDFYLAVTDAGTEIYTTPLGFLSGLDARHRITSLYRIPTRNHPEFNGQHEQFRSARVVRTRRHPDHLKPVFQYSDRDAVIAAKNSGEHPSVIPTDNRSGRIAFVDKFGNTKLELAQMKHLSSLKVGRIATLVVRSRGKEYEVPVHVAEDLRSAPLGKLAVYANCSDLRDKCSGTGFVELITRVSGNPSKSKETAIFQLNDQIPKLDPAGAEVELVA